MNEQILFAGLDVGSLTSKSVLLGADSVLAHCTVPTGSNPRLAGERALEGALAGAGRDKGAIAYLVGTGYGRVNLPGAQRTVTELTCHARGAHFANPKARTVIDIGGQDSKVIRMDANGNMVDFAMNDKCAAGTGRFLEVMARALELDLEDLGAVAERSAAPCPINSICAVFAESEVVSLLAAGHEKQDVVAGLHQAVAQRVGNMAARIGIEAEVVFVGGVAKNRGVARALERFLGISFVSPVVDPQINGALGAAVLARDIYYGANHAGGLGLR